MSAPGIDRARCARRSVGRVLTLAAVLLVALAAPAAADPPRPTDFRTEVVGIDPPVDGIEVRLLGGDAFLEIAVASGREVVVTGYRGEPFVRYHADGTVEEDIASSTSVTSQTRYGSNLASEGEGEPQWKVVARDGSWSWHDHRAHWMSPQNPPGKGPGDQVLEGVVPLTVDGQAVEVQLATWWIDPPPAGQPLAGVAAGAVATGAVFFAARRRNRGGASLPMAVVLGAGATCALAVGIATRIGVPAEAAPSSLHWILPALALACATAAFVMRGRLDIAVSAVMLGALSLLQWGWWRRAVLDKPVLPTGAPFAVDRVVTAAVLGAAAVVVVVAVGTFARLLRSSTAAARSTGTVHP